MRISDWSSDGCSSDLPDPLRPGGEADRPSFPAVDNVVSGKLASLNRTRFAGEALHQLIGDFLGPPSAVRRHIIRNGNGRAADNLPEIGRATCRESVCQYG